jgi:hypothetical protein
MEAKQYELWKKASTTGIQINEMQKLWFDEEPPTAPLRQEPKQQQPQQRSDPMSNLPQRGSHEGRHMGKRESGAVHLCSLSEKFSAKKEPTIDALRVEGMPQTIWTTVGQKEMGRVAKGIAARVDRLKAIGNGQVPQCAAEAWRLLNPTGE